MHFKKYLIAGLLFWLPLAITVWVLTWLYGLLDGIFLSVLGAADTVFPGLHHPAEALRAIPFTVSLTTKLNEGHVHGRGRTSVILPVLARGQTKKFTEMCGARLPGKFLAQLDAATGIRSPRAHGHDVVGAIRAMEDERVRVFVALGVPRGYWTIVVAHATVGACFAAIVVHARLVTLDRSLEEAARTTGATASITARCGSPSSAD